MILKLLHVSVFITHYWSRLFAFGRGRYGRFVHGLSIATAVGTMVIVAPARAGQLTEWQFDPDTQQLELTLSDDTTPSYFLLAQPTRIVVDLPNTVVDRLLEEESFSGDVRNIRVSQFAPGLTRIVIELSPQTELSPSQVELRHVTPSNVQGQEQWIVRPVFASSAIADTGVSTPSDLDLPGSVSEAAWSRSKSDGVLTPV
ncbi:MAG: AMIN domain-containing protein, partial [Cyanobacteria bacterium J06627_8]